MAPLKCPFCASDMVVRIVYGAHAHTKKLERDLESGRVVLGRGTPTEKSPLFQCQECGTEWGASPRRRVE